MCFKLLLIFVCYLLEFYRGVQLFREFGFDDGGDFAAPACLLKGELAVLPAALAVCFPSRLVCRKFGFDAVGRVRQMGLVEFAFPYGDDVPRDGFEPLVVEQVALLIAGDLRLPELDVGLGNRVLAAALVPVPEASVHEDVHPVAVAPPPQLAPHLQLGTCVLAADVRHAEMPLLQGEGVWHGVALYAGKDTENENNQFALGWSYED